MKVVKCGLKFVLYFVLFAVIFAFLVNLNLYQDPCGCGSFHFVTCRVCDIIPSETYHTIFHCLCEYIGDCTGIYFNGDVLLVLFFILFEVLMFWLVKKVGANKSVKGADNTEIVNGKC